MKRKGYCREMGSEGSVEQTRESMDKNRIQGVSVGRAAYLPRSPLPSSMQNVDPATVRGRRLDLPQEICPVSRKRLRSAARRPDHRAEVSRGHIVSGNGEGPNERSGE